MLKGMSFTVGVGTRPLPTPVFRAPAFHQPQSHVHRALPQDRVDANNNYAQQRVFMFDPSNPSSVEELMVEPHQDTAAAEELLAAAEQHAQAVTELTGRGSSPNGTAAVKRTPIPLRSVSPMPSRNRSSMSGRLGALQQSQSLVPMNGRDSAMTAKSAEMQKQLVSQLEKEQTQVAHLQQYEVLYKEWRMKAERLDSDIGLLQRLVAEKDAELAHGYKLLESSAAERSRLRHSFLASQEKAKQLQAQLAQAEAKALTAGPPQGLLGNGSHDMSNGHGHGNGRGRSNGNGNGTTLNMTNMQGMIEELSMLAKGIAQDMSLEVTTVANMPGRRDS